MLALTLLAAALLSGVATPVESLPPIPDGLKPLKAHEVVMQVRDQKAALSLSDEQVLALDALHNTINNEKHQWKHQGGKPHEMQHVPMISKTQAYRGAMGILTREQQQRCQTVFGVPAKTPAKHKYTAPHGKP